MIFLSLGAVFFFHGLIAVPHPDADDDGDDTTTKCDHRTTKKKIPTKMKEEIRHKRMLLFVGLSDRSIGTTH